MATGNLSNYWKDDPIFGSIDLDDEYITNQWLVDQFVGNNLFGCGYNSVGELGVPTLGYFSSPAQVGALTTWKQVATGYIHTSSIKTDGTLWAWGANYKGQLGVTGLAPSGYSGIGYSSPIQVGALTNWKQVSCSSYTTAAIKTDSTLWTWGNGTLTGQLGNGFALSYSSPIQIGSLTNWKQVSCGYKHTAAIKSDGTLWTWGDNRPGNLGNSTNFNAYSSPIQVGALTNWKQVSCGYGNTAAIKTDGTLWTWGNNNNGQLGNGNTLYYSSPCQVSALTSWKEVGVSNGSFVCVAAIKTDGTLWTWGYNASGQLGNGTTINYSSPIQVGSLTNWKKISCGRDFIHAVKTDGTLWSWGSNFQRQLGNGTAINYSSPIQVGSLTNWKQVSCGDLWHTMAITFADIT